MRLSEVQKKFRDTMLDHPKVLDDPPADFAALFDAGDIPLPERLKVYRNNIVGSITDTVIATYPLIEKLVGREFLEGMARSFVLENPPQHGCLNMYGAGFDAFIENFEPAKSLPYLPDVARLEIAMNDAYYAPDDEALSPEALGNIPPEELTDTALDLRSSVYFVSSGYPLGAIRDFCLADDPDKTLDIDTGGVTLMVYRPALDVKIITLEKSEHMMLAALQEKKPLGQALEETVNAYQDFDFQAFLARHLELETFCALPANSEPTNKMKEI